eukprot:713029-Lingulodinium_polyedra.AAC.1
MAQKAGHGPAERWGVAARERRLPDDSRTAARHVRWQVHQPLQAFVWHGAFTAKSESLKSWKGPNKPRGLQ